jgi:hypothetical protein
MRTINLHRKQLNAEEQQALKGALLEAYKDKGQGTLLVIDEQEDEILEAVLVPAGTFYEELFTGLASAGSMMMHFDWEDPELPAQLGLCVMQLVLGGQRGFILGNEAEMFFALVSKDLFNEYE